MMKYSRRLRLVKRGAAVLCTAAACLALAACEQKSPAVTAGPDTVVPNPDPKPQSPSPLLFTLHFVNDSMMAIEYTASDTIPFATAYLGLESSTSRDHFPHGDPYPLGWELKTRTFSPPRYTVHATDTFPARNPGGNLMWALAVQNTAGGWTPTRWGREYLGPREFSLVPSGIPPQPMQQPGIELTVTARGPAPVRGLAVYLDSGSAQQRVYGPIPVDSSRFNDGLDLSWRVWVTGPLGNGKHALTLTGKDSLGRLYSNTVRLDVQMPTPAYHVVPIRAAGAIDTRAEWINLPGDVVGTYRTADSIQHAFKWAGGNLEDLPSTGRSRAALISDAGMIVGYNRGGSVDSIVQWTSTGRRALAPGDISASLRGITDAGDFLYGLGDIFRGGAFQRSPLETTMGMNNQSVIVGAHSETGLAAADAYSLAAGGHIAVFMPYSPQGNTFHRCCGNTVRFVNDRNQMIGSDGKSAAAFFSDRTSTYWTVNQFGTGTIFAMSRWTLVLGRLTDGTIAIWQIGGAVSLPALDSDEWTIDDLSGINERGQIIAHGINRTTGQKAALLLDPI